MNRYLWSFLLHSMYVLSAISLFLILYSITKLKKRGNNIIYILKPYLYLGYLLLLAFFIFFVDAIHIDKLDYTDDIAGVMVAMFFIAILGNIQLWMWVHYEIEILEDKLIYHGVFCGKEIILFDEIDCERSSYIFVHFKNKLDFGHEVLFLKMKSGREYKFKMDAFLQERDIVFLLNILTNKLKIESEVVYK